MKVVIVSPDKDAVLTPELCASLSAVDGGTLFCKTLQQVVEMPELQTEEEKILALDPDSVNWHFGKEEVDSIRGLRAICLQTTSFSWVDKEYCASKGIPVTNLRGFSTEAVAEYALGMLIQVMRKFPLVLKNEFKQDCVKHQGRELRGKRVGIVGLGTIGKRFAELCSGMGMEVMYWSRASEDERFKKVSLPELISSCDVVFPGLAQNEETKALLSDELLSTMKSSAVFVSVVHQLYNHDLLLRMVKENKLHGYAFEEENADPRKYDGNVFAVPSLAWATAESMKKNGEQWIEAMLHAVKGEYPTRIN